MANTQGTGPNEPDHELGLKKSAEPSRLEVLGLLSAGVAHELNNLLFVIRGTAEISRMGLSEDDQLQARFGRIEEAVDRAQMLTTMVLDSAKPTGGLIPPIQLHPLVKECVKIVAGGLPDTIEVRQRIATDAAAVAVDPVSIFKVVMALLSATRNSLDRESAWLLVSLNDREIQAPPDSPTATSIGGPALVLTIAHGLQTVEYKDQDGGAASFDSGSIPISKVSNDLAETERLVQSFGGHATCRDLAAGGHRFEVVLPMPSTPPII